MLQIFTKPTLFAVALVASCAFSLIGTPRVFAQHHQACKTCKTCPTNACPTCGLTGHCQQLNCRPRTDGQPQLFYNYYVPGTCGGMPVALYLAPRPVPPIVGHTYYTYQPFLPHELLYVHDRTYHRYYDNGRGLTRTHISWYRPPVRDALGSVAGHLRLAR